MTDAVAGAGAVRQLHPDAGDEPGPRPGRVDDRCPRTADPQSRADGGAEPEDRVPPERRGHRRAQGRPSRPRRARAGGGHGLLQDPPLRRAARVRPARGLLPRARPGALLPAAAARALRGADARAPPAPRDHRHRRRQPARRPRRHDVRLSGSARRPGRRRRRSRGRTRSPARCSRCGSLGGDRGARQPGRRARSSCRC